MDSFFALAFSLVNGFTPALKKVSLSILANKQEAIQKGKEQSRTKVKPLKN